MLCNVYSNLNFYEQEKAGYRIYQSGETLAAITKLLKEVSYGMQSGLVSEVLD